MQSTQRGNELTGLEEQVENQGSCRARVKGRGVEGGEVRHGNSIWVSV